MLVTRIIGKCPGCGAESSFGNVNIWNNTLCRGCLRCSHKQDIPLPELSKSIIYLDQSFFSHAFRAKLHNYVECTKLITELSHKQLIVCPYSSTHETETHQWRSDQQQELWDFIKRTSRGHAFSPHYEIKHSQISGAYELFLVNGNSNFSIARSDASPENIDDWDGYFWVDVRSRPDNIELIRKLKVESTKGLINLFSRWQKSTSTFDEDLRFELRTAASEYLRLYKQFYERMLRGDTIALIDSPIDYQIVETLIQTCKEDDDQLVQLNKVVSFLQSLFFENVPYEYISCGLIAVLKDNVKNGQFQNIEKAEKQLSGFFYDLEHISAYSPYCDAMFVDNTMYQFVKDKRLSLNQRYGTKFFASVNFEEFIRYLKSFEERMTKEMSWALKMVYPEPNSF